MSLDTQDKEWIRDEIQKIRTDFTADLTMVKTNFGEDLVKVRTDFSSDLVKLKTEFVTETNRYLATLLEKSTHDMAAMKEFMSEFPTRSEVREIVREEIQDQTPPIVRHIFMNEFLPHVVIKKS